MLLLPLSTSQGCFHFSWLMGNRSDEQTLDEGMVTSFFLLPLFCRRGASSSGLLPGELGVAQWRYVASLQSQPMCFSATLKLHQRITLSNKISKHALLALCEGNPPVTGGLYSHKVPVTRKTYPCYYVIILNFLLPRHRVQFVAMDPDE